MRTNQIFGFLGSLALAALVVFGGSACGGGGEKGSTTGSSTGGNPNTTSVSLKANTTNIDPGQSVVLSWTSKNASRITTSNFGASDLTGTVTVTPNSNSTYTMTVSGNTGEVTSSVTIKVNGAKRRFVIVGDSNNPEVPSLQQTLNAVGNTSVQQTLPTSPSTYECLVIHVSGDIGPSDNGTIQAALAAGKGVVVLGFAPAKIATGATSFNEDNDDLDTTAVASWFGSVTSLKQFFGFGFRTSANNAYFALPSSIDVSDTVYANGPGDNLLPYAQSGNVSSVAWKTIANTDYDLAFAFKTPTGGKVYWQFDYDGNNSEYQERVTKLFKAAALWAANP